VMWALEVRSLISDDEGEIVTIVGQHFSNLRNESDRLIPMQIAGQFAT